MILDRIVRLFTSLKLTVVLLALGLVLVFWGTLAQVELGLYRAQNEFFRSFFIFWQPKGSDLRIPIFPGGYMVGGLMIINLIAAHFRYYKSGWKKVGIILIHVGLIMLLVGQLLTDFLAVESVLHLREGETKNYTEASREFELAVTDTSDPKADRVVSIPSHRLRTGGEFSHADLPFKLAVKKFLPNSSLVQEPAAGYERVEATAGVGSGIFWKPLPHETTMARRDMPSGLFEVVAAQGSAGTYLISAFLNKPQELRLDGKRYLLELRLRRFYKPFSVQLIEFNHDRYPGTEIPKNFSSLVRVRNAETGEDRQQLIKMNSPLRYKGETYYQSSFDPDDQGSILQVVRNPSWLTPYLACVIVSAGLLAQFGIHLVGFAMKRRKS